MTNRWRLLTARVLLLSCAVLLGQPLVLASLVPVSAPAEAAALPRARPYAEQICNTDPNVFFCEDFEGQDIRNLGSNNCGSTWGNPAIIEKDICWAGGGSYQNATIPVPGMGAGNRVWRVTKTQSFTDVVTGINTGTGGGTIAGWLNPAILGTGARDWYMRTQVYFSPDTTWPSSYDIKHGLWALPRVFIDPPSAEYEAGLFVHHDFWCNPPNQSYSDVPHIRYSNNFQEFPYQNEYCPPLAPGLPADGVHAPRYQKGRWYTVEIHYKLGTSGSTGRMQMWLDGRLAFDASRATCVGTCGDMGYVMILGWMNSADAQTGYLELDNIVFSRAPIGLPGPPSPAPATPSGISLR